MQNSWFNIADCRFRSSHRLLRLLECAFKTRQTINIRWPDWCDVKEAFKTVTELCCRNTEHCQRGGWRKSRSWEESGLQQNISRDKVKGEHGQQSCSTLWVIYNWRIWGFVFITLMNSLFSGSWFLFVNVFVCVVLKLLSLILFYSCFTFLLQPNVL